MATSRREHISQVRAELQRRLDEGDLRVRYARLPYRPHGPDPVHNVAEYTQHLLARANALERASAEDRMADWRTRAEETAMRLEHLLAWLDEGASATRAGG